MKTPLWQALSAHVAQAPFSTHTPGHKSGQLIPAALKEAWGEAYSTSSVRIFFLIFSKSSISTKK